MRPKQLSFIPSLPKSYGGELLEGRRKTLRPIDPKKPLHLTLRASQAKGAWSLLHPKNEPHVSRIIRQTARKRGVRVYRLANVGNHLHLLVRTRTRRGFQAFLREMAGAVAMAVTGARKGHARSFWDARAFTRIVEWGRDLRNLELYFIKNLFETSGLLARKLKAAGARVIPLFGRLAGAGPPKRPGMGAAS